jgi:hypothetical protein
MKNNENIRNRKRHTTKMEIMPSFPGIGRPLATRVRVRLALFFEDMLFQF